MTSAHGRANMTRPILATIHRAALSHNLNLARQAAGPARVWAVIKANAYGHGLLRAAQAFAAADGFAVLNIEDAIQLRQSGIVQPILLLEGVFAASEYQDCAHWAFTPVIHAQYQLDWLQQSSLARPLSVYLKINTGMNRLGIVLPVVAEALRQLQELAQVADITLMTHFARADEDGGIAEPLARFKAASTGFAYPHSLANSAALLSEPQSHGDWVRPGIMLYGATPFAQRSAAQLGLQAAMTLSSRLIAVQTLAPGDSVGYGSRFTASRPVRIGVVACGYADGYPRHAPNGTPVVVAGVPTQVVGTISMDMLTVDISAIPQADIGSPVELWGRQMPVDAVANAAGTVGYELMCALAPRVPVAED